MKALAAWRPLIGLIMLLTIVQLACGLMGQQLSTAVPTVPGQATALAPAPGQETPSTPGGQPATGEQGTPAQAQAMLKAAVEHYQTVGRDQALKDFNDQKPPFTGGGLYVVCLGEDHKITALGAFPLLVGTSADALKDPSGTPIGQLVWEAASIQPEGQVPFRWKNPLTGQEESKVLFYQKLSQDICGVAGNQP